MQQRCRPAHAIQGVFIGVFTRVFEGARNRALAHKCAGMAHTSRKPVSLPGLRELLAEVLDHHDDLAAADETQLLARDGFDRHGIIAKELRGVAQRFVLTLQPDQIPRGIGERTLRTNRLGQSALADETVREEDACSQERGL